MTRRKSNVLILMTALLIIGVRGVCAEHFSERASIDKSDTHVQLTTAMIKSTSVNVMRERIGTGFNFRVKRYVTQNPSQNDLQTKLSFTGFTGLDRIYRLNPVTLGHPYKYFRKE